MAKLTKDEVVHVANLAKLTIKESEVRKFKNQLSNILDYASQIGEMKTRGVPETSQVTALKNGFRKDKIDSSKVLTQDKALASAKRKHKGYFVVKAIFE